MQEENDNRSFTERLFAPSFYGDAFRNFNSYPEFCLSSADWGTSLKR